MMRSITPNLRGYLNVTVGGSFPEGVGGFPEEEEDTCMSCEGLGSFPEGPGRFLDGRRH